MFARSFRAAAPREEMPGDGALLDADGIVIPPGTVLTLPNVAPDAAHA